MVRVVHRYTWCSIAPRVPVHRVSTTSQQDHAGLRRFGCCSRARSSRSRDNRTRDSGSERARDSCRRHNRDRPSRARRSAASPAAARQVRARRSWSRPYADHPRERSGRRVFLEDPAFLPEVLSGGRVSGATPTRERGCLLPVGPRSPASRAQSRARSSYGCGLRPGSTGCGGAGTRGLCWWRCGS